MPSKQKKAEPLEETEKTQDGITSKKRSLDEISGAKQPEKLSQKQEADLEEDSDGVQRKNRGKKRLKRVSDENDDGNCS